MSHPIEIELQALQATLARLAPDRRAALASLLNALLVNAEANPASQRSLDLIAQAICAQVEEEGGAEHVADLARRLADLARAAPRISYSPPDPDADEPPVRYSLGPRAAGIVALMRYDLGLSAPGIHRILTTAWAFPTPFPDLVQSLRELPPPPVPSPRRRRKR